MRILEQIEQTFKVAHIGGISDGIALRHQVLIRQAVHEILIANLDNRNAVREHMIGGHLAGVAKIGVADTRRAKLEPVDTALRGIPSLAVSRLTHRRGKRSEEHTSELQSLMRISSAVFCLEKKNK